MPKMLYMVVLFPPHKLHIWLANPAYMSREVCIGPVPHGTQQKSQRYRWFLLFYSEAQIFWEIRPIQKILWKGACNNNYCGLFRLSAGVGGISQTCCGRQWDWSVSVEVGGIQNLCRCRSDWSNFLQEQVAFVKISAGAGGTGWTFKGSGWDWSNFLQEQVGLVEPSVEAGRIGQTLQQEQAWLVRPSVGVGRIGQKHLREQAE